MTSSWGFACADGPLQGEVLMLSKLTEVGSLFSVGGPNGDAEVYQFAGNHFDYVGPNPAEKPHC